MEHADQLVRRAGRIGERPEDVEDRAHAELLAHRRRVLHRAVVVRREHEADAGLGDALRDLLGRQHDVGAERLEHVGAARLRRHRAVAVLGDARAGRRGDEHRRGRDVERVRRVAAGADDVDAGASRSGTSTLVANSRITCAAAAISPIVSFLTRRPTVSAAIITGDTSPLMIRRISDSISSWKISRCSIVRCSASCSVMAMCSALRSVEPAATFTRSGAGNCAAVACRARSGSPRDGTARLRPACSRWRTPMISPSSDVGGDLEARRAASRARSRANGSASRETATAGRANTPSPSCAIGDSLAVHHALRAHDRAAERLADRLVAEAHAENRDLAGEALDQRHRDAGLVRRARPRRDHDALGRERVDLVERDLVVAHARARPRRARRGTGRGCR